MRHCRTTRRAPATSPCPRGDQAGRTRCSRGTPRSPCTCLGRRIELFTARHQPAAFQGSRAGRPRARTQRERLKRRTQSKGRVLSLDCFPIKPFAQGASTQRPRLNPQSTPQLPSAKCAREQVQRSGPQRRWEPPSRCTEHPTRSRPRQRPARRDSQFPSADPAAYKRG